MCEALATASMVPVNMELAPVFEPVTTAPVAVSHGVRRTRPAGSSDPMAVLMPVVVMIHPISMNAAVPAPMGAQDRAADNATRYLGMTVIAAITQAAASQNGGEAMMRVSSEGNSACSARARSRPIVRVA